MLNPNGDIEDSNDTFRTIKAFFGETKVPNNKIMG